MNTTSTRSTSSQQPQRGQALWRAVTCGLMLLALSALLSVQILASASAAPTVPLAGLPPTSAPKVQVLCVDDNGGATDAPCTNPTAFTTIQSAISAAVAGDEIRVAAGSYGITTFDKSLTVKGGYAGGPGGWSTTSPSNVVALNGNVSINSGLTLTMGDFFTLSGLSSVNGGTLVNTGTLTKVGGGAVQFSSVFNNSGTVNVTDGTLLWGFGNSTGAFNISAGATIELCNCGHHFFLSSSVIQGAGTLRVAGSFGSGGDNTISGTLTIPNLDIVGGRVNIDSVGANTASSVMTLTHTAGTLGGTRIISVTNALNLQAGQFAIAQMEDAGRTDVLPGAQLNISGSVGIAGRVLNNYGTGTWSGGGISIGTGGSSPGTFNNHLGASFTILNNQNVETGGGSTFNNFGTMTKTSTGPTSFGRLNNSGTVNVQAGTVSLGFGSSAGAFNISAGATIELCNCGHHFFLSSSVIQGAGTLRVAGSFGSGGDNTISGTLTIPNLDIVGGRVNIDSVGANTASSVMTLTHTAGTLGGTRIISVTNALNLQAGQFAIAQMEDAGRTDVLPGAQLNISGSVGIAGRVLNNYGTGTWSGGGISIGTGSTFNNRVGATFTILNDQTIETGNNGPSFNNMGTFIKQSSSGTTRVVGAFNNSGLVEVRSGALRFECCPGATQTGGVTRMAGGNLQFDQPFQLQGGSLEGSGTVTGSVNNTGGTVSPGASPGLITITGNYTQGAGGALNIELGGTTPVTSYDRLDVGGPANLNGTLNVTLTNGFVPSPGDSFIVMNYASRTGVFATYNGPPLTLQYNTTNLTLGDTNPTPTPTATAVTATPSATATASPSATASVSTTATASATATSTLLPTGTPTNTSVPTSTSTAIQTSTVTQTPTATAISTATVAPTLTRTSTALPTSTRTSSATVTATPTVTLTATGTTTPVGATSTATPTRTATPINTLTLTPTRTSTTANTSTSTSTPTRTGTATGTLTATRTATRTVTVTITPFAPSFSMNWHTIDGGGGTSAGGSFTLDGTIGQPDAGTACGGNFSMDSGFWYGSGLCSPPPPTSTSTTVPPTSTRTSTRTPTTPTTGTFTASPTPTPRDYVVIIATGTIVPGTTDIGNHCDSCVTTVRLPFGMQLYDRTFSSAIVGSNGTIGFVANSNPNANTCMSSSAVNFGILPFWSDLTTVGGRGEGVYTSISGATPNRIFNIEWRARYVANGLTVNFQVRVYERFNRMELVYGNMNGLGGRGTIGVQRDTGSQFTEVQCRIPGMAGMPGGPAGGIDEGVMVILVLPDTEPTPTPTVCPIQFSDVPPNHTFYQYVRCLACRDILSGYSDGTFRPGNEVTRGQIAKIVSNASGFIEDVQGQTFIDVPPNHTFYAYVERIAIRGIISGYSDGTFRPHYNATRGQIAKIVANAASFSEPVTGQTFTDVPPNHTFYEYIERMAQRNIIGGYSDGTFRPQNNATRGQTAKIVANTFFPNCQTP